MNVEEDRAGFAALAQAGAEDAAARALAARLKARPDPADLKALAALLLHAAAAAPERAAGTYDAAAEGWLGAAVGGPHIRVVQSPDEPIPAVFWQAFWALLAEPGGLGTAKAAPRTADLEGLVSPRAAARATAAARAYPGVAESRAQAFTPQALARSLGAALGALGGDPEVLAGEARRLVAGYQATKLHEVAAMGFQLAQSGSHHAAMFLGLTLARVAYEAPEGGPLLLDTILSAWAHGRTAPPLMGVNWPKLWDRPVDEVRARLGVTPYASPWPADIFERAAA